MSLAFSNDQIVFPTSGSLSRRVAAQFFSRTSVGSNDPEALLEQMLDLAADADRKLAEQQARIVELEALAATDELTGLINRRGLETALTSLLSHAARHGNFGIICYLDIDDFKGVNDTYGHAVGDAVLKRVSQTISDGIRVEDVAARVGGDEFVVVLPDASVHDGVMKARRLQKLLSDITIDADGEEISLGISMGMQPYDGETQLTEILHRADCAMYAQKRAKKVVPLVAITTR